VKKAFALLFLNTDGSFSTSKTIAMIGAAMLVHVYFLAFIFKEEMSAEKVALAEILIGFALGLRGVDRFSRYGLSSLGTLNKKEDKEAKTEKKTEEVKKQVIFKIEQSGHFKIDEFASPDGAPMPEEVRNNLVLLMQNLETIRKATGGKPITISSGWRSAAHNKKVDGKPKSQHLYGNAADIKVKGMRPASVAKLIKQLMDAGEIEAGGLKAYSTFTHYDRRGDYVTW